MSPVHFSNGHWRRSLHFCRAQASFGTWALKTQYSRLRPRIAFPDLSLADLPCLPIGTFQGPLKTNLHGAASFPH
jgi:hypothetical protein